jgi:hypothetical protein
MKKNRSSNGVAALDSDLALQRALLAGALSRSDRRLS